ncbi:MAG: hypothetical protein AAF532_08175 [Planctomycetota bacterium]
MRTVMTTVFCLAALMTAHAQESRSGRDVVRGIIERSSRGSQQNPPNANRGRPARTSPVPNGPSFRIGPIRVTPGAGGVRVTPVDPGTTTPPPRRTLPITTPGYPGTGRPVDPGVGVIVDPVPGIVIPVAPPRYEVCPVPTYVPPTVGGTHTPTGRCRVVTNPGPEPELPVLEPGQQITLFGENFGPIPGEVLIGIGPMIMRSDVTGWADGEAVAMLPDFPLANEVVTDVAVKRADGVVAHEYQVRLVPKSETVALPVVYAGQNLTISGRDLGAEPGKVVLSAGPLALRTEVLTWAPTGTVVALPRMTFREEVEALLTVTTAAGVVADEIAVRFSPDAPPPPAVSGTGARVGG